MPFKIRLIADHLRSASFNMAADMVLIDRCASEDTLFLRFYSWEKPSITIGLFQKASQILKIDALKRDAVDWIRRPTGGRAVFHYEDLTYSCIFSPSISELGSSIKETYAQIAGCLHFGLKTAGIPCETHDSEDELLELKREVKLPCFLAPNRDEIMVEGKKLVGSAQRRTVSGVLQHGSIPITDAYLRLPEYLTISDEQCSLQKRLLQQKTISIHKIDEDITYETLQEHICQGFGKILNVPIIDQPWSPEELSQIDTFQRSESFQQGFCSP